MGQVFLMHELIVIDSSQDRNPTPLTDRARIAHHSDIDLKLFNTSTSNAMGYTKHVMVHVTRKRFHYCGLEYFCQENR